MKNLVLALLACGAIFLMSCDNSGPVLYEDSGMTLREMADENRFAVDLLLGGSFVVERSTENFPPSDRLDKSFALHSIHTVRSYIGGKPPLLGREMATVSEVIMPRLSVDWNTVAEFLEDEYFGTENMFLLLENQVTKDVVVITYNYYLEAKDLRTAISNLMSMETDDFAAIAAVELYNPLRTPLDADILMKDTSVAIGNPLALDSLVTAGMEDFELEVRVETQASGHWLFGSDSVTVASTLRYNVPNVEAYVELWSGNSYSIPRSHYYQFQDSESAGYIARKVALNFGSGINHSVHFPSDSLPCEVQVHAGLVRSIEFEKLRVIVLGDKADGYVDHKEDEKKTVIYAVNTQSFHQDNSARHVVPLGEYLGLRALAQSELIMWINTSDRRSEVPIVQLL